ncbi:unnamed protein product [Linum trigynum]|uniref:Uncharacterized protein n=1 Tax=Linum trigynum TaxID=586398 RepID=A0AAV2DF13_9ROSI
MSSSIHPMSQASQQSRKSQGSNGSPMGRGYQSTPLTDLNDIARDEETPPFVISHPARSDKQKVAKKKGKRVVESSESYTAQLLDCGSELKQRQASREGIQRKKNRSVKKKVGS